MANKNVKEYRKIYNRKLLRNMLKKNFGTNKIKNIWHRLRSEGKV